VITLPAKGAALRPYLQWRSFICILVDCCGWRLAGEPV